MRVRSGSTLALVLVMMLTISVLVSVLAVIVVNHIQATTNITIAVRNLYTAESGLERGLYDIAVARQAKIVGADETAAALDGLTMTLEHGSSYTLFASADASSYQTSLLAGASSQFDITDEAYTPFLEVTPISNISTLMLSWNEDCSATTAPSQLEVTVLQWEQTEWEDLTDPSATQIKYVTNCIPAADTDCAYQLGLDSSHLYRVRIKALQCAIPQLTAQAFSSTGEVQNLHNEIVLSSLAKLKNHALAARATTLWRAPATDLVDYVLFSEEVITK